MFGGWPHELLSIPIAEYNRLKYYYFAVKDAESEDSDEPDDEEEE